MSLPEEVKKGSSQTGEAKLVAVENPNKGSFSSADISGGNLDKVREILVGPQIRNYEKRLARLEEKVVKDNTELKDEMRKRFDSLESYIRKEIESLSDRLKVEERERTESSRELSKELKETSKMLEKKLTNLDDNLIKTQRDLNQQISDKTRQLSDEIRNKYEDLLSLISREIDELRLDKTDRSTLAGLFTEVAMRLNNEFKIPGGE